MEHDIDKAVDYSHELLDEVENQLSTEDLGDLYFSTATSIALQGDSELYDKAIKMLEHCLEGDSSSD